MASTDTSPESTRERVEPGLDPGTGELMTDADDRSAGFVQLLKDLGDDIRTLIQQEIELARLEVGQSAKRVAVDGAWIWAGAVVLTVGLICLALALALGIGALLDSYWLGALATGGVFLLIGALLAWRGIRDLTAGGLLPTNPLDSWKENRDWARQEMDDLKQGISEEI